jgi:hypothetical protein
LGFRFWGITERKTWRWMMMHAWKAAPAKKGIDVHVEV